METFSHIWNIFVQGNLFNFVLFLAFFAWVFKKIKFGEIIQNMQKNVENTVNDVKTDKDNSVKTLKDANTAIKNLDKEISEIVEDAKKSAKSISEKIKDEAEKQVLSIEQNSKKIIEAEEKKVVSILTKRTSSASVEVAKSQIEQALIQTPSLHEKYINESINELDRLNF